MPTGKERSPWAVDTVIIIDVYSSDPEFGRPSAECLVEHSIDGLVLAPISYVELSPAFLGDMDLQDRFLREIGVGWPTEWILGDTHAAHSLWADHVRKKRAGHASKRPIEDVFIRAFATRLQGVITRNAPHFTAVRVIMPTKSGSAKQPVTASSIIASSSGKLSPCLAIPPPAGLSQMAM